MQYNKKEDGTFESLSQKNVDTGMGLERALCALIGAPSVYETEIFAPIIEHIEELSGKTYKGAPEKELRAFRIVADHLRTAVFILGDPRGVTPSNVDQGYVLRRLIRRAVRFGMDLGLEEGFTSQIAETIINRYKEPYPELEQNRALVLEQLLLEEQRFQRTLQQGTKMFEKLMQQMNRSKENVNEFLSATSNAQTKEEKEKAADALLKTLRPSPDMKPLMDALNEAKESGGFEGAKKAAAEFLQGLTVLNGRDAFKLYDTYGFPFEMTMEMAKEQGLTVDKADFDQRFKKHQETSQAGAQQRFKGGLADGGVQTTRLHTATHLLHAALRKVLGEDVHQKGSNITAERLRFDFSFGRKMTKEELDEVESLVNQAIQEKAPITFEEMTVAEAEAQNAIGLFESKYGEKVKVYTMGRFSKEICGGPHAENTGDLGSFKIQKEESSSAGVRRIRATISAQP
jgi:alanyl-tRNA synthetase